MKRRLRPWVGIGVTRPFKPGTPSGRRPKTRPLFEALETRNLLSGIFYNATSREITIDGTAGGDVASVAFDPRVLSVAYDDQVVVSLGGFASQSVPFYRWQPGGFLERNVLKVVMLGQEGGDTFTNRTSVASTFLGGIGNDTASGGSGDDTLDGGPGLDTVHGEGGNDTLYGWTEDDRIFGGYGDDVLWGYDGNDTLDGGPGLDTVHGEGGNDTLYGWTEDDRIFGGYGDDVLWGYDGNDTLDGGPGLDTVHGEGGNDTLYGWTEDDRIFGGYGDDVLWGYDGNDTLDGGPGLDTVHGEGGNDTLYGMTEADKLYGEAGDDVLDGGAGADLLNGGPGNNAVDNGENDQRVIYLNFDGATISRADLARWGAGWQFPIDNLDSDRNGIVVQPYRPGSADREQIIDRALLLLYDDLSRFGINVQRATGLARENQRATTLFVGNNTVTNGPHIAGDIDEGNDNATDVAFVGGGEWWNTPERTALALADVALHEAGHTYGLYHVTSGTALETMGLRYNNPQSFWVQDTAFLDQWYQIWPGHGPNRRQNSFRVMVSAFGLA